MIDRHYQNDFTQLPYVVEDGCLFICLVNLVQDVLQLHISDVDVVKLVNHLHYRVGCSYSKSRPVLSDEDDLLKEGAFVWDHERVLNETAVMVGSTTRFRYVGRIYMPWEEKAGALSWGSRGGDELILHVRTSKGGHFIRPNHDPWRGGTKVVDLKSIRYYEVV